MKEIQTRQLAPLERTLTRLDIILFQKLKNTRVDVSFIPILQEFKVQSLQLQLLLFTLAAPMIAMVFYYIVMNARQSLDRRRTVIAVIRRPGREHPADYLDLFARGASSRRGSSGAGADARLVYGEEHRVLQRLPYVRGPQGSSCRRLDGIAAVRRGGRRHRAARRRHSGRRLRPGLDRQL
ncbi:hypothetical protein LJK88_20695 [Paenibacillus sp. P26]|nr:hypothetical protein LJK88_20695 [Paenibacillus sp. P26]